MKKNLILLFFLICFPLICNAEIPFKSHLGSDWNAQPVENPVQKAARQGSILNIQAGIRANQNSLNRQYFGKPLEDTNNASLQNNNRKHPKHHPPHPGMYPNAYGPNYIPRVYRFSYPHKYGYVIKEGGTQESSVNKTLKKAEIARLKREEAEKIRLTKKYAYILNSKTLTNPEVCSKIALYYKTTSKEELDRILNNVLNLNCTISDLRP